MSPFHKFITMMSKKGQVEIQFNWIFVLIAGTLIFLFFFTIIKSVTNTNTESNSLVVSRYFDSIITSAQISKDSIATADLPVDKLTFDCSQGFNIDNSQKAYPTGNKIIFSPTKIDKGNLVLWTKSWNVPFRVTDFLYITSPKIRYILITNDENNEIYKQINESLPPNLKIEKYDNIHLIPPSFSDNNNFKVRFIYINTGLPESSHLSKFTKKAPEDITALKITGTSMSNVITVNFYRKSLDTASPVWTSIGNTQVFDIAPLLGAVIVENSKDYDCAINKAFDRLHMLSNIYSARTSKLALDGLISPECAFRYITDPFNRLSILPQTGLSDLSNINSQLISLEEDLSENSCPTIY